LLARISAPTPFDGIVSLFDQIGKLKRVDAFGETNVIPPGEISTTSDLRPVFVACHPVGPLDGLFKEMIEKMEKETGQTYLDPSYHWAAMVGNYYHELNPKGLSGGIAFFHIQNGYRNGKLDDGKVWTHKIQVGFTNFNDSAIVAAGESQFD
jgi:hypothetical protein